MYSKAVQALTIAVWLLFAAVGPASADAPTSLSVFKLGEDVARHEDRFLSQTDHPLRNEPFLNEVTLQPFALKGYRIGYLAYGNCASPGSIVRLKMKYANDSRDFYDELLKRFKKEFGDPEEWRGDPFHNVISWKWSLRDKDSRVSVVLTHSKDEEEKPGNSLKMTERNLYNREQACYEKKFSADVKKPKEQIANYSDDDFSHLIPR